MGPIHNDDIRSLRRLYEEHRRGDGVTQSLLDELVSEWEPRVRPDRKDHSERFVVADVNGIPNGIVGPRWAFHLFGLRHKAVEVVMRTESGLVALQRRSLMKEDWPGLPDVTVSGHVPVNNDNSPQTFEEGAWKEIEEEIGICEADAATALLEGRLEPIGTPYLSFDADLHRNPPFYNAEVRQIFTATLTGDGLSRLHFTDGEVSGMMFVTVETAWEMLAGGQVASGMRYTLPRFLDWLERR